MGDGGEWGAPCSRLGGSKGEVVAELGAASSRGEGEARRLCWGCAVSYFPFWSLQGFVWVFSLQILFGS